MRPTDRFLHHCRLRSTGQLSRQSASSLATAADAAIGNDPWPALMTVCLFFGNGPRCCIGNDAWPALMAVCFVLHSPLAI